MDILEEVSKLMAIPGWDLMNMQKSILKQRVGIQNMGDNHPRMIKRGLYHIVQTDIRKVTM